MAEGCVEYAFARYFPALGLIYSTLFIRVSIRLALADQRLFIQAIQQLFEDVGHPIQDLNEAATARYLTGSIDLVYFDGSVITLPTIRVIIWVPISAIMKKPTLNTT